MKNQILSTRINKKSNKKFFKFQFLISIFIIVILIGFICYSSISLLKKELNKVIDWSKVNKEDYLLAMERSPVKDLEIKMLLQGALTNKINDRQVFMKGIDISYQYEGYNTYSIEELDK